MSTPRTPSLPHPLHTLLQALRCSQVAWSWLHQPCPPGSWLLRPERLWLDPEFQHTGRTECHVIIPCNSNAHLEWVQVCNTCLTYDVLDSCAMPKHMEWRSNAINHKGQVTEKTSDVWCSQKGVEIGVCHFPLAFFFPSHTILQAVVLISVPLVTPLPCKSGNCLQTFDGYNFG